MPILILILVLLAIAALLPFLFPLIALIAVFLTLGRTLNRLGTRRPADDEEFRERRFQYKQDEDGPTLRDAGDVPEITEIAPDRPSSVRDDAFWEKDHTVYDVPFEETEQKEDKL